MLSAIPNLFPMFPEVLCYLPICSGLFSEQIRVNPFCLDICQVLDAWMFKLGLADRAHLRVVFFWGGGVKFFFRCFLALIFRISLICFSSGLPFWGVGGREQGCFAFLFQSLWGSREGSKSLTMLLFPFSLFVVRKVPPIAHRYRPTTASYTIRGN